GRPPAREPADWIGRGRRRRREAARARLPSSIRPSLNWTAVAWMVIWSTSRLSIPRRLSQENAVRPRGTVLPLIGAETGRDVGGCHWLTASLSSKRHPSCCTFIARPPESGRKHL